MRRRKPVKLTLKGVKKAARRFYERGKLTAQTSGICVLWEEGGARCALGAALPYRVARSAEKDVRRDAIGSTSVGALLEYGYIAIKPSEVEAITRIQNTHDAWAGDRRHPWGHEAHQEFRELIGLPREPDPAELDQAL